MLLSLLALLAPAFAGERTFAFSYGYGTVPKGGVEVEHYTTMKLEGDGETLGWEHQVELEYGITDRLEAGLYFVGRQTGGGPLSYRGFKARGRYRLGNEGVGPVDTGLYLEYISSPTFTSNAVEAKVILAKKFSRFESALNVEYKVEFSEDGVLHEFEPTCGIGLYLAPAVVVGLESKTEIFWEGGGRAGPYEWAGPSLHLAGEGGKLWVTLAGLVGVTEATRAKNGFLIRSLVAVNL